MLHFLPSFKTKFIMIFIIIFYNNDHKRKLCIVNRNFTLMFRHKFVSFLTLDNIFHLILSLRKISHIGNEYFRFFHPNVNFIKLI